MRNSLINLTYEIELQPGEKLTLPESLVNTIGEGRWFLTIYPATERLEPPLFRSHAAFLNGYAPGDEGLYDDYSAR
jgi:hypothetical protein